MSRLPFELMLALRYLRPKRTSVSVITLISVVGVMLGVAVLIIVIAVMSGFDRELRDKIVSFSAHLRIEPAHGTLEHYDRVMSVVQANPLVKGVAPYIIGQVLVKTEPENTNIAPRVVAPLLRGVDPRRETSVSRLPASMVEGKFDVSGYSLLVGRQFADKMGLEVGDHLAVYSVRAFEQWEDSHKHGSEESPLAADYTVTGIFELGMQDYDSTFVITSLANAQDFYGLDDPDSVHGLFVALHDPEQAARARTQLAAALGPGFVITTWLEENSEILQVLAVEKYMMFYLLFFITIVAAFGICSALITFVVQKTREIGALKALGATGGQVMCLFLAQSLAVGVVGVLAGLGLGLLAVAYRNDFLRLMRRVTGIELFPADIYHFYGIPAWLHAGDIGVICGGSLLICVVVGGLIPAWNAARLKPAEALRHE
jgi:lipoprotein-releasing system permease protein